MSKIKHGFSQQVQLANTQKLEVLPHLISLNLPKQSEVAITEIIRVGKANLTLFTGENSAGKLAAAGYIANRLNLKLYKIDLGSIVNKYIGETEKNLSRLLEHAEKNNWILFFDEADALFGKRTNVKDSHDKYANIEVSHLLDLIESYKGIAMLSTNIKNEIDKTFLRRLRNVVQFPFPVVKQRKAFLKGIFPSFARLNRRKRFITVTEINGSNLQLLVG